MTMEAYYIPLIDASMKFNSQVSEYVIDALKYEMDYVLDCFGWCTELISRTMNGTIQFTTEILPQLVPAEMIDISKMELAFVLIILYLLFAINKENLLHRKLYKDLRIIHGISKHTKCQKDQSSSDIDEIKKRLDKNRNNRMPHLIIEVENMYKQLYNRQDLLNQLSDQMDFFRPTVMAQESKLRHLNAALEQDDIGRVKEIRNAGRHVDVKLMEINARLKEMTMYIKRELRVDS